ncbi:MAG: glycosyltransferase family 2 protein [Gemmatimonadaceae bacterium]
MHQAVAAVVVTYNRRVVLRETLRAVLSQTRPPDEVVVVDNGRADGSDDMVRHEFPGVVYLPMSDNLGYAAGLAAGMRHVIDRHEFIWLLDDDSRPAPPALERCLGVMGEIDRVGVVGLSGGTLVWGIPDHDDPGRLFTLASGRSASEAHFSLVDGALVSAKAAREVGYPREDFFLMMEDVEYTGRLWRAGWKVILLDEDLIDRGHMGSMAPLRHYYSARNHLVMALQHRSARELVGWAYRQAKYIVAATLFSDQKAERIQYRLRGAWDGARRRMGRTHDQ